MLKSEAMQRIPSSDAEIAFEILGDGPPVVLLHPFPSSHEAWLPAAQALTARYRVILPDLRGHGESDVGEGPATMDKHVADLTRILDHAQVGRAAFAGVSLGGYALFEFWRRVPGRIAALALIDTRAQADSDAGRAGRLQAAAEVLEHGVEPFIDSMLPKLLGKTTHATRPDLVEGAKRTMMKMSPQDISLVQKGMAERPDSVSTLKSISVPALVVVGEEDVLTPPDAAQLMRENIRGSQLRTIPRAGHYAVWEQPEEVGRALRQFLDSLR